MITFSNERTMNFLSKFSSHVQQLDMESNGKKVSIVTNDFVEYDCGPIVFGEPGTN